MKKCLACRGRRLSSGDDESFLIAVPFFFLGWTFAGAFEWLLAALTSMRVDIDSFMASVMGEHTRKVSRQVSKFDRFQG